MGNLIFSYKFSRYWFGRPPLANPAQQCRMACPFFSVQFFLTCRMPLQFRFWSLADLCQQQEQSIPVLLHLHDILSKQWHTSYQQNERKFCDKTFVNGYNFGKGQSCGLVCPHLPCESFRCRQFLRLGWESSFFLCYHIFVSLLKAKQKHKLWETSHNICQNTWQPTLSAHIPKLSVLQHDLFLSFSFVFQKASWRKEFGLAALFPRIVLSTSDIRDANIMDFR